jgi:hypothetical protein
MKSDGVLYEAFVLQNHNKIYTFEESIDANNLIKLAGVEYFHGNVVDHIYPFNNIDDFYFSQFSIHKKGRLIQVTIYS